MLRVLRQTDAGREGGTAAADPGRTGARPFRAIHPFRDGNDRVGRLVITLLLVERDVLKAPLLYLSAWFEATRSEYYARLLGTTARGEWHEWVVYFLHGVALEAEDAARRMRTIDRLMLRWRTQLAKGKSKVPETVLELFRENSFWTTTGIARRLDIAFTTAGRAIERLEAAGIVSPADDAQRNRVFWARQMLEVLEWSPDAPDSRL